MKLIKFSLISSFLLAYSAACFAQAVSGSINGLITDPSGAALTQAAVTVTNSGTGVAIKPLPPKPDSIPSRT